MLSLITQLLKTKYNAFDNCKITLGQQHCTLVTLWPTRHDDNKCVIWCAWRMSFMSTASCTLSTCMLPPPPLYSTASLFLPSCLVLCVSENLSMASHLGSLVNFHLLCSPICVVTWYRVATMPCTWLHKVGTLRSSNTCCLTSEQGSMTRMTVPVPCSTGQPRRATVR